jgi:Cof subfamily protein (haloacid dehalogenase superfamily)
MMARYKLLALDLDGTLLSDDKTISKKNKLWIERAVAEGVTVIFATGRGYTRANEYQEELELDSPMVLLNGADVWAGPHKPWQRHFLTKEIIQDLYALVEQAGARYWGYHTEGFVGMKDWPAVRIDREEWMKFGMYHNDLQWIESIRDEIQAWDVLEVVDSGNNSLELSVRGVTKESGVRAVCSLLGIEMHEVMAIGDAGNDLRLLRSAGLGVAMENAVDRVKEAADVGTVSNEEDGVAIAIQRYLLS